MHDFNCLLTALWELIIFVNMSMALLTDGQMDSLRSAIAKDKKEQLDRARQSFRKFKKDKVKEYLSNPQGISDNSLKESRKEAIKDIVREQFQDSLVTATYDRKIIELCEKQNKEKNIESKLALHMLYTEDEAQEKLNDEERIRSEYKSRGMAESRKQDEDIQQSIKQEQLMSPSSAKEEKVGGKEQILLDRSESCSPANRQMEPSYDERQSSQRQSFVMNSNEVFVTQQNEPSSQQDASFSNSFMNSPTFTYDISEQPHEKSQKKEQTYAYPQLSPPKIDSVPQEIDEKDKEVRMPQPKLEDIFENLHLKEVNPQPVIEEIIAEQLQEKDRLASPQPKGEIETTEKPEKAQQIRITEGVKEQAAIQDIPPQSTSERLLQPQRVQPEQQQQLTDVPPSVLEIVQVKVQEPPKKPRVYQQFLLQYEELIAENIIISAFADQKIHFTYKILPRSAEHDFLAEIIGIQAKQEKKQEQVEQYVIL